MKKYSKDELYKMSAVEIYKLVLRGDIIKKFPNGFWQRPEALENAKECVIYMLEGKLKLNEDEIRERVTVNLFKENKLSGMLHLCFNDSPYQAIDNAFPGKYKEWEFKNTPNGFWTKEKGKEVTRWLIEDKLKLTEEELKEKLSSSIFEENGLRGMLGICFKHSPFAAIESIYPRKYKEWEFKIVPLNFWNEERGIAATKWLLEEKLNLTDEQIKESLSANLFRKNRLGNMLNTCFENSPYSAVNAAYPDKFKKSDFKGYTTNGRDKW